MSKSKGSVGFCGLGAMGFGMAVNLVKEGYNVKGFDVFPKSIERFKEAGGISASTLAESAEGSDYYVCMVANAEQAQSILFEASDAIVKTLPNGAALLLCSTVSSSYAMSVQQQLNENGRSDILFVDCPVSGGAKRAADGTLSIMAGGSVAALSNANALLETMSSEKKLFIVDGGIGAGSNMKMVHQVLAAVHILVASEAMGYAARIGLDPTAAMTAINKSDAWAWMFENRVPRMLNEDFYPGVSALTIILKDVGIITAMARLEGFPTPMSSIAEQVYMSGLSRGFGSQDDAGMVRVYCNDPIKDLSGIKEGEDFQESIKRIETLLTSIYLCSTAEAFAFAKHLGLSLDQFFDLAADAAGGSTVFRNLGPPIIEGLKGNSSVWTEPIYADLDFIVKDLSKVIEQMQQLKCPAFLGTGALNVLLLAQKRNGNLAESSVLNVWDQWCRT